MQIRRGCVSSLARRITLSRSARERTLIRRLSNSRWLRRFSPLLSLLALGLAVAWLYVWTSYRLNAAQQARRNESYHEAERQLDACWPLPGLRKSIKLERALLGVQQGDLADEARAGGRSADSAVILEALAKGNLAVFRWNEARTYAQALLDLRPAHAQALWLRGRAWVKLQQEDKAHEDFDEAVQRDPSSAEFRLALAELLLQQGELRQAVAHYELLHRQWPDDERMTLGLARCRHDEGRMTLARELVDGLLASQPRLVPALVERGRLALRLGDPAHGERWLRKAVEASPLDPDANFVLQLCLDAQGKDDGELRRQIEEDERARAALRERFRAGARDATLFCDLGTVAVRTGKSEEIPGWFYLALQEDPHHAAAHAALADYFERAGQPHRSLAHRQRASGASSGLNMANIEVPTAVGAPAQTSAAPLELALPAAEATSDEVHQFCGQCHAYPPPESMPRAVWRREVKRGYDFVRDSRLAGELPSLEGIALYYERRAPEQLPMVDRSGYSSKPPLRFERRGGAWLANLPPFPGVSHVSMVQLDDQQPPSVLVCDTRLDQVLLLSAHENLPRWTKLGPATIPGHAIVTDLDGDGRRDILVASLGQFYPTDDKVGSVVWLRGLADGTFAPLTLLDGVGRISDVQAADFSGDGRLDLVVAVFGWRKTGEILYFENRTTDWSHPAFVPHEVDGRHGSIHVPVADLNHDGRPDFVALLSQEHETVVAYLNEGDGQFCQEIVFAAPIPSYGSSGIQVVDLDGDDDADVLLTNGDVLDRPYVLKPYHGVQWLENRGTYPFTHHSLAPLCGASQAVAADMDGDRDLDVVAVSFLPRLEFPERERLRLPSIVLLEQTESGQFARHVLETGACDHFTCAAGDWDGDGRTDLAVGNFSWKRSQEFADAVLLLRNAGP